MVEPDSGVVKLERCELYLGLKLNVGYEFIT